MKIKLHIKGTVEGLDHPLFPSHKGMDASGAKATFEVVAEQEMSPEDLEMLFVKKASSKSYFQRTLDRLREFVLMTSLGVATATAAPKASESVKAAKAA